MKKDISLLLRQNSLEKYRSARYLRSVIARIRRRAENDPCKYRLEF
jgi:hypothetical protein